MDDPKLRSQLVKYIEAFKKSRSRKTISWAYIASKFNNQYTKKQLRNCYRAIQNRECTRNQTKEALHERIHCRDAQSESVSLGYDLAKEIQKVKESVSSLSKESDKSEHTKLYRIIENNITSMNSEIASIKQSILDAPREIKVSASNNDRIINNFIERLFNQLERISFEGKMGTFGSTSGVSHMKFEISETIRTCFRSCSNETQSQIKEIKKLREEISSKLSNTFERRKNDQYLVESLHELQSKFSRMQETLSVPSQVIPTIKIEEFNTLRSIDSQMKKISDGLFTPKNVEHMNTEFQELKHHLDQISRDLKFIFQVQKMDDLNLLCKTMSKKDFTVVNEEISRKLMSQLNQLSQTSMTLKSTLEYTLNKLNDIPSTFKSQVESLVQSSTVANERENSLWIAKEREMKEEIGRLSGILKESEKLGSEIDLLTEKLKCVTKEKCFMENSIAILKKECKDLKTSWRCEVEELQSKLENAIRDKKEIETKFQNFKLKNESDIVEIEDLELALENASKEHNHMKELLNKAFKEEDGIRNELAMIQFELQETKTENLSLKKEIMNSHEMEKKSNQCISSCLKQIREKHAEERKAWEIQTNKIKEDLKYMKVMLENEKNMRKDEESRMRGEIKSLKSNLENSENVAKEMETSFQMKHLDPLLIDLQKITQEKCFLQTTVDNLKMQNEDLIAKLNDKNENDIIGKLEKDIKFQEKQSKKAKKFNKKVAEKVNSIGIELLKTKNDIISISEGISEAFTPDRY